MTMYKATVDTLCLVKYRGMIQKFTFPKQIVGERYSQHIVGLLGPRSTLFCRRPFLRL